MNHASNTGTDRPKNNTPALEEKPLDPWRILIVDKNPLTHTLTQAFLKDVTFLKRPLYFLTAHTEEQARQILHTESNLAVVLLGLRLETNDAGFTLTHVIRNELKNTTLQIVLRTNEYFLPSISALFEQHGIDFYLDKTQEKIVLLQSILCSCLKRYHEKTARACIP